MENPEEILHSLEEFSKLKPKDIPRELEDYLCFVAKTGDPVYQWSSIKSLFREKLVNVITEFYESCPTVEIPPCPNVEMFNYDSMKNFILEKLDTFAAAPFTVQRICELLTTPRKEYNRIDKYMRALEKNILVVSTTEPANRRNTENGEGIVNGIETEHVTEANSNNDINVEEMDDSPSWPRLNQQEPNLYGEHAENGTAVETQPSISQVTPEVRKDVPNEPSIEPAEPSTSTADSVITCMSPTKPFVSIEPVAGDLQPEVSQDDVNVTITAIPAPVQKRRDSIEPLTSDDNAVSESISINKTEGGEGVPEEKSLVASDEESKPEIENKDITVDKIDTDSDSTNEADLQKNEEIDNPTEQETDESNEKEETPKDEEGEKEASMPNPIPEPETQESCDNSGDAEDVRDCVVDTSEPIQESTAESVPAEDKSPETKSTETLPKPQDTDSVGDDTTLPSATETGPSQDSGDVAIVASEAPPTEKDQSEVTPMDVDPDENLIKESTTTPEADLSNNETNPN